MDILIIGGTRFFGYQTTLALHDDGHDVAIFTRGRRRPELPDGIEHLIGDRENDEDLERAAAHRSWDVVWDNMSRTAEHARPAVRIFRDRCDLFIHTSTLAVYSVCEGIYSPYREEDFARGRPLEERRGRYPYDYGLGRRDGEEVLQEAHAEFGFPYVAVRLPMIFGPRDYSLRAWAYWRRLVEGGPLILPDSGAEMHRMIYSHDCAQAIRRLIEHRRSVRGRAYNFGGREIVSLRRFVELSAEILARDEVEIVDIPSRALEDAGLDPEDVSPFGTWANHIQSIERARSELGFEPTPLEEWLPPTLEWHLEERRDAEPPGWEARSEELELAKRWKRALGSLR